MATHVQLYDSRGKRVVLGRQLGAGGEGAVFDVQGTLQLAAKLYKHQPTATKADKLTGMARHSDPDLASIAAWPMATLHKSPSGPLVGFLMPKIVGYHPVHTLYSPANRKFAFPSADWAFLIHAARNMASAVAEIHAHGHVVGDINQGNVLVSGNATVKLIDCDSFQIQATGRMFLCEVGVPEFTPPELHGLKTFAGLTRNNNHDAFGLAVLIFHLVFMGRHPFAGRFLGTGDKPIEDAIKEFRFAFGQAAALKQMAAPPHSLSLLKTSTEFASLFERAFSESAARGTARPTAQEWVTALEKIRRELVACAVAPAHKFHRSLTSCPWCDIQRNAGPDFFISVTLHQTGRFGTTFDLSKAWNAITAIPQPDISDLVVPRFAAAGAPTPFPPYSGFSRSQALFLRGSVFVVAVATVAGLPIIFSLALSLGLFAIHCFQPNRQERRKREREVTALELSVRSKEEEWSGAAKNFHQQFANKMKALGDSKKRYEALSASMKEETERLEQARESEQRKDFLDRHFIKDYKIDGIGRDRRATLLSYGIETLYDVTPRAVDQVPGFGPALTAALVALRRRVESQFRFDPTKGVDPTAVGAINQKYALQRVPLEKLLLGGAQELASINKHAKQQRMKMNEEATGLARALSRARVNAAVREKDYWPAIVMIILICGLGFRFAVSGIFAPELVRTTDEVAESSSSGGMPIEAEPPIFTPPERSKPVVEQNNLSAATELKERLRARYIQKNDESRAELERIQAEEDEKTLRDYQAQETKSSKAD